MLYVLKQCSLCLYCTLHLRFRKGFSDECQHLMVLNPFIIECSETFKQFFKDCCSVEETENQFNINKYTEAVLIAKPDSYISLTELCDSHQLSYITLTVWRQPNRSVPASGRQSLSTLTPMEQQCHANGPAIQNAH